MDTRQDLIRCLVTFADWWQPTTTSVLSMRSVPTPRDPSRDPFQPGLLDRIEERAELHRRLAHLEPRDREILFHFYVSSLPASEVAERTGLSIRQCFRRRNRALDELLAVGQDPDHGLLVPML